LAKKRSEKPKREITKRQFSKWQQQKRRQHFIIILGAIIIAAVLGVVITGWYVGYYHPLHQTVIKVNDTEFSMSYYIKTLKFYAEGQPVQYRQYLADNLVKVIERNELIKQEAEKLGISVSNDEVDAELKSRDPSLSKDYRDIIRTDMLVDRLNDEYFDQEVSVFAEQRHIMAMFLESESQAKEVGNRLGNGEDFGELAEELSLEGFTQAEKGDLGWHPRGILTDILGTDILEEHAFSAELDVLSGPAHDETRTKGVGYWLIEVLERDEEEDKAHVQAMLLGSEEEALQVKSRLEAGADFAALVEEFSQDDSSKEEGGDLGWINPGEMSSAFDEFAFNSEVELGKLSEPVKDDTVLTEGGYWLVKVLEKDDNREISDNDRDFLKAKAFNEWVSSLWDDPENEAESNLTNEQKAWAIEQSMKD